MIDLCALCLFVRASTNGIIEKARKSKTPGRECRITAGTCVKRGVAPQRKNTMQKESLLYSSFNQNIFRNRYFQNKIQEK